MNHGINYSEEATGHKYGRCTRDHKTCPGCRDNGLDCFYDSLSCCKVCGCLEGSLLPFCPGRLVTMDEQDAYYAHYCAATGPFARATLDTVGEASRACHSYYADDVGSMPPPRPGAWKLHVAVTDLLSFLIERESRRERGLAP